MSQNRKKGRPRGFDVDAAVLAATHLFWEKGYDGTSMRDLTDALGINSPSLYAVFGDKRGLYLKTIERYMNDDSCAPIVALDSEENIEDAVRAFLKASMEYATDQPTGREGCFMSNCVSTTVGSVEGTKELFKEAIESADIKLASRFEEEVKKGNLPESFPCKERGRLLFDLRQGQVMRARAGITKEEMKADLDFKVQMVLYYPKP